jgi:hypothetical protein
MAVVVNELAVNEPATLMVSAKRYEEVTPSGADRTDALRALACSAAHDNEPTTAPCVVSNESQVTSATARDATRSDVACSAVAVTLAAVNAPATFKCDANSARAAVTDTALSDPLCSDWLSHMPPAVHAAAFTVGLCTESVPANAEPWTVIAAADKAFADRPVVESTEVETDPADTTPATDNETEESCEVRKAVVETAAAVRVAADRPPVDDNDAACRRDTAACCADTLPATVTPQADSDDAAVNAPTTPLPPTVAAMLCTEPDTNAWFAETEPETCKACAACTAPATVAPNATLSCAVVTAGDESMPDTRA